jgi:hypothetical protein
MDRDERDRLVVLEEWRKSVDEKLTHISSTLDKLAEAAAMGRGAWWLILKIGSVLLAVGAALGWLADKLIHLVGIK